MPPRGLVRSKAVVSPTLNQEEERGNRVGNSEEGGEREVEDEHAADFSSASRPGIISTSDPELELRATTLPEWISVMPISGTQYTIHVKVSLQGPAMEPSTCINMTDFLSAWGGLIPCDDDGQWENVGRALKGYSGTQSPNPAQYKLSFEPLGGRLTVAWKGGGGGEKGKGRASGEEVVSMVLEEKPNKAELVQSIFEAALRTRDERAALTSQRLKESEEMQRTTDESIKAFKTEGEQIQREKRRMLQQISLLIDNKKVRLEELQLAGTRAAAHAAQAASAGGGEGEDEPAQPLEEDSQE